MQPLHDIRSRSLSAGTCEYTSRITSPKRDFAAGMSSHTSKAAPLDVRSATGSRVSAKVLREDGWS